MTENKNLVELVEENIKILKSEYQRGFADGGKDMNEKWLITTQEFISKFVKHIDKIIGECQNYQQYFEELIMMKEFYEEKLK